MNEQPLFLVKVDPIANNNKFYRMIPKGAVFTVEYGRVGYDEQSARTMDYSINLWDKKLHEKLKKGYIDQTRLVISASSVNSKKKSGYIDIANSSIREIVAKLQTMAKQAIVDNYTVESSKVTGVMIDEAQGLIGLLGSCTSVAPFNMHLVDLFRTIPRKMGKVADYLANNERDFEKILQREQDLLDVMRGQVVQQAVVEEDEQSNTPEVQQTILDALGLQFFDVTNSEIETIKNNLGEINFRFSKAWKVINNKTQAQFDKFIASQNIRNKKLLWHGSKNENWWSIANAGLLLRPSVPITGKMFGMGIYFASSARKSFGYTSHTGSYWVRGSSPFGFMGLFDCAYGTPFDVYNGRYNENFNYVALQRIQSDANCLHAHTGTTLRNDEIVFYREDQVTIKYLVELL